MTFSGAGKVIENNKSRKIFMTFPKPKTLAYILYLNWASLFRLMLMNEVAIASNRYERIKVISLSKLNDTHVGEKVCQLSISKPLLKAPQYLQPPSNIPLCLLTQLLAHRVQLINSSSNCLTNYVNELSELVLKCNKYMECLGCPWGEN